MMKHSIRRALPAIILLATVSTRADTIVLEDGNFIEGKITLKTSRAVHVATRFGTRIYQRNNIQEIISGDEALGRSEDQPFVDLLPPLKAYLNAEADYKLQRFDSAMSRLKPYRDYTARPAIRRKIDWLIIELNERMGQWDEARKLLEEKKEKGLPQDKIRAETHLDLLDANPNYDLRYVGETHARNFILDDELRNRARRAGALKDPHIMRVALEQACEQLLVRDKLSVKAFAKKLDFEETYEACKKLPVRGHVGPRLPYIEDLKRAEAKLTKARAILGAYGSAFELDLAQTEMAHLLNVGSKLLDELVEASPESFTPPFDRRSGLLTPQGRVQWRQRCDDFLDRAQPAQRLLKYMIERVDSFPDAMRELRKVLKLFEERVEHAIKAAKKARNRTHV